MKRQLLVLLVPLFLSLTGCMVKTMQFPIERQAALAELANTGKGDIQIRVSHPKHQIVRDGKKIEVQNEYYQTSSQSNLEPGWVPMLDRPPRFYTEGDLYQAIEESVKAAAEGAGYHVGNKGPVLELNVFSLAAGLQSTAYTPQDLYSQAARYTSKTRTQFAIAYALAHRDNIGNPCTMIVILGAVKDGDKVTGGPIIGNRCQFAFETTGVYSKLMSETIKDVQWESVKFLNGALAK